MSVIKEINFECRPCGRLRVTSDFSFDEGDDGACGDPECCCYRHICVSEDKTVHVAADQGTSLDAVFASAEAHMEKKYGSGVKKNSRTHYKFKSIAPTHPLADVQHDTTQPYPVRRRSQPWPFSSSSQSSLLLPSSSSSVH